MSFTSTQEEIDRMDAMVPRLLYRVEGNPWEIQSYFQVGGYEAWRKCVLEPNPENVIALVKQAALNQLGMGVIVFDE